MAAEYGLRPTYKKEFHEVFAENSEHQDFKPLLQHMKVVDAHGESQMDEDQWEAASTCFLVADIVPKLTHLLEDIYLAFAFTKG